MWRWITFTKGKKKEEEVTWLRRYKVRREKIFLVSDTINTICTQMRKWFGLKEPKVKSPTNTHKLATRFKTKLNYKHSQHGVNKITVKMEQNDWENLSLRKLAENLKNITELKNRNRNFTMKIQVFNDRCIHYIHDKIKSLCLNLVFPHVKFCIFIIFCTFISFKFYDFVNTSFYISPRYAQCKMLQNNNEM